MCQNAHPLIDPELSMVHDITKHSLSYVAHNDPFKEQNNEQAVTMDF